MGPYQAPEHRVDFAPALSPQDVEHLDLLVLTGRIWGWLTVAVAIVQVLVVLVVFIVLPMSSRRGGPHLADLILLALALVAFTVSLAIGICTLNAAGCLKERRNKNFIQIMAALNCLSMPLGTLWGIFVFVVLSRPTVAAAFEQSTNHQR